MEENYKRYVTGDEYGAVVMLKEQFPNLFSAYLRDCTSDTWFYRINGTGPFNVDILNNHTPACCNPLRDVYTKILAEETERAIINEETSSKEFKELTRRINASIKTTSTVQGRARIIELASQGKDSMAFPGGNEWHDKADQIPLRNLIITLKNGSISVRPYNSSDFIRNYIDIEDYDPTTTCPKFCEFLEQIFLGDEDVIHFMQVILGYALLRRGSEHVFLVLFGKKGANGKSSLTLILAKVFGKLTADIPVKTILARSKNADMDSGATARPDLLSLQGKAIYITKEPKEEARFDSGTIKNIVSQDSITARGLYSKEITVFTPQGLLLLCTNHIPHLDACDGGLTRRFLCVPFEAEFVDDPQKPNEFKKIEDIDVQIINEEKNGILNWLIEGAKEYQKNGLPTIPATILNATKTSFEDEDIVETFLKECCEEILDKNKNSGTPKNILYICFKDWCTALGNKAMTYQAFRKRILNKGFTEKHTNKTRFFEGIILSKTVVLDINDLAKGNLWGIRQNQGLIIESEEQSNTIDIKTNFLWEDWEKNWWDE